METNKKAAALAKHLDESDLDYVQKLIDDGDYLVLTDEEVIQIIQEAKCEGANETLKRMLEDETHFIQDAISSDGRGHFISGYDGHENEEGEFYIYRIN